MTNVRALTANPAADRLVSDDAMKVVGGILAAGAFLLMLAIVWFAWDSSRRIR